MAWINQSRFKSAYGQRQNRTSGRLALIRKEIALPKAKIAPWTDFWLQTVSVTANTKNFSDTIGGTGGGATDFAF